MNVPDSIRKCVVFLAYESHADGEVLAGTAFLLAFSPSDSIADKPRTYLITAAHVINGIKQKGANKVIVRVNTKSTGTARVETDFSDWAFHPTDSTVDVAAMLWRGGEDHDFEAFPADARADQEIIAREGITLGEDLFIVGLYTKHAGKGRNVPIVRVGNIAAMPEEPLNTKGGAMHGYLAEIRSIGGISGSPVFVRPTPHATWGLNIREQMRIGTEIFLLGLMHGQWDMKQLAPVMFEIDADYLKQPLNSGIAVVVPVAKILEVIAPMQECPPPLTKR